MSETNRQGMYENTLEYTATGEGMIEHWEVEIKGSTYSNTKTDLFEFV